MAVKENKQQIVVEVFCETGLSDLLNTLFSMRRARASFRVLKTYKIRNYGQIWLMIVGNRKAIDKVLETLKKNGLEVCIRSSNPEREKDHRFPTKCPDRM